MVDILRDNLDGKIVIEFIQIIARWHEKNVRGLS
jgi:hypothetical protein